MPFNYALRYRPAHILSFLTFANFACLARSLFVPLDFRYRRIHTLAGRQENLAAG